MPTGTYYVKGVKPKLARSRYGKVYQVFDVFLADQLGEIWRLKVSTTDALKASLAKRAGELGRPIRLGMKDGRFGAELVTIEFATESAA